MKLVYQIGAGMVYYTKQTRTTKHQILNNINILNLQTDNYHLGFRACNLFRISILNFEFTHL